MYVAKKEGLIQRSMQENTVVGVAELKDACAMGETDHAVQNDGRRSSIGIMAR